MLKADVRSEGWTMMRYMVLIVALLASRTFAFETICKSYPSDYGDVTVWASNVLKTTEWKQDQPLPLSPQDALARVEKQLPREGDDWWHAESVALTSFDYDRWFYVVTFTHVLSIVPGRNRSYSAAVLMDGSVLLPRPKDATPESSVAPWMRYANASHAGNNQSDRRPVQPDYAKWLSITNGMTKAQVMGILGHPIPRDGTDLELARIANPWNYGYVAEGYEFDVWFQNDRVMDTEDPFGRRFSTNGIPTAPLLIYPHTNAVFTHYPRAVDFRWFPSSGEYPVEYQLDAGSGSVFTFEPHGTAWMAGMGRHRWRVRAINRLGVSPWTEWREFEFTK